MDKAKGIVKGGWRPPGDPPIHRKTWKSDIKSMAPGGKKPEKKHYENAMDHQSAPLGSLKDPDTFGAPPKHKEFYDEQGNSLNPVTAAAVTRYTGPEKPPQTAPAPSGGWGRVVPTPNRKQQEEEQKQDEEEARAARGPYKTDTTGLRTDNLPAPPLRRDAPAPVPPLRNNGSPASPPLPQRQPQPRAAPPPPTLPPRMNENPDEYTPPAPPSYNEATQPVQQNPAALNTGAVNRLAQAGVSVPGFGIGNNSTAAQQSPTSPQGHTGQLSELQQRFARMKAGSGDQPTTPTSPTSSNAGAAAAAAHTKPPPPPPPKKPNLTGSIPTPPGSADGTAAPPPLPLSSKPRPS